MADDQAEDELVAAITFGLTYFYYKFKQNELKRRRRRWLNLKIHKNRTRSRLPPPPTPPRPPPDSASPPHHTALDAHLDHMHAVIGIMSNEESRAPTPPPAPPAPPPPEDRPRPPSPASLLRGASALKPTVVDHHPAPDPRSDLLKAIREGIKLRKVEKRYEDNVGKNDTLRGAPALHDVSSILARRVAVEQSDSEDDDSDEWTDCCA